MTFKSIVAEHKQKKAGSKIYLVYDISNPTEATIWNELEHTVKANTNARTRKDIALAVAKIIVGFFKKDPEVTQEILAYLQPKAK